MIQIEGISAGYGKSNVLNEVSFSIKKGELTSLIGVNGCGKSTLLKTIIGIHQPDCGTIAIDGFIIDGISRKEMARKVAYLSQHKNVPDMSVLQMVLLGRYPHLNRTRRYSNRDYEIVFKAMQQMGVDKYANYPIKTLSGGMLQNTYIAMALAQDTDYILLDEPTTHLDISHQCDLMKNLKKLAEKGKGIVMVMHDLPMAMTFSDNVVVLNQGSVIASGDPQNIHQMQVIKDVFGVTVDYSKNKESYSYQY